MSLRNRVLGFQIPVLRIRIADRGFTHLLLCIFDALRSATKKFRLTLCRVRMIIHTMKNLEVKTPSARLYCPICRRVITAENEAEVDTVTHDGYLFVHDDVEHTDNDIQALEAGLQ